MPVWHSDSARRTVFTCRPPGDQTWFILSIRGDGGIYIAFSVPGESGKYLNINYYWILNGVFIKFAGLASDDIFEKFDLNKGITKLDHNGVLYDVIAGF